MWEQLRHIILIFLHLFPTHGDGIFDINLYQPQTASGWVGEVLRIRLNSLHY